MSDAFRTYSRIYSIYGAACILTAVYACGSFRASVQLALVICAGFLFYTGGRFISRTSPDRAGKVMKITFALIFLLYVSLLADLTLFSGEFGRTGGAGWNAIAFAQYLHTRVNVIPLRTIRAYFFDLAAGNITVREFVVNILGNLAAFMPFGFFLPLLFAKQKKFHVFLPTMVCIVAAVELLQLLLMTGACDIDDLLINVSGALILWAALKIPPAGRLLQRLTLIWLPEHAAPQDILQNSDK